MTSYTAVGGGQTPSMTVNFKMNITTYGPHNGIFITSGIQQGTSAAGFFAAHTTPNGTIIAPSVPAIQEIPSSLRGSTISVAPDISGRTTIVKGDKLDLSRSRSTSRSRPSSPLIDFYGGGRDSPPDEFIEPQKVKLNVFNEDKPYVQYPTDLLLNDTKTTTTTVEVFRSKVNPDNPVDFFELPPNPLGSDSRSQLVRASGPPYEVVTRAETRFSNRPELTGSISPLPRAVQWGSRTSGLASSHSPSYGYGSLERNRPVSQTVQTRRDDWIDERDGAYQTMITRRQFSDEQEQKLQDPRTAAVFSPTLSAGGRVYPITVERDYYYDQQRNKPRPLRYTTSQPNVFQETSPLNRSLDDSYRVTNPRYTTYPDYRLRRARSRSETRSDDYYYDRNRPTSGLSNISRADSWSNSVNNIFKLYQTRDCLGNVLYELPKTREEKIKEARSLNSSKESLIENVSPRKESTRYDNEMLLSKSITATATAPSKKPILKSDETISGRKSRVEFIEPELTDSARSLESNLLQTEPSELFLDVPISTPDDFDTPRKSPPFRHWIEQPRKIVETDIYEIPKVTSYSAPICLESKESISYIPKQPPAVEIKRIIPVQQTKVIPKYEETSEIKPIKMTEFSDKVQISQSTTAELAKHGWISPRFARNTLPVATETEATISLSQKSLIEDEWPMPPVELSPKIEQKDIVITTKNENEKIIKTTVSSSTELQQQQQQPSTSSSTSLTIETITTKPATVSSSSFAESLKAQFSHSPSIAPSSPSPKAASSPKIISSAAAAAKPPLPPSSSLRRPLITQFDTEPRRVLSTSWFTETSFEDSLNSTPSVSFTAQNPPNPLITVKAEGATLRLSSSLSPP